MERMGWVLRMGMVMGNESGDGGWKWRWGMGWDVRMDTVMENESGDGVGSGDGGWK